MSLSYLEYLKNKNNINNKNNALASQLMQDNSWLEVSKGSSNNSGTINDLSFLNTQNALSSKAKLDIESANNEKNYNAKENFTDSKELANNMLGIFGAPSAIKGTINSLYDIANSGVLDKAMEELLNGAQKATKAINSVFKGLF